MSCDRLLRSARIVTTEEVLNEFLTALRHDVRLRTTTVRYVEKVFNPRVLVIPQSHHSFLAGFSLYRTRLDKEYSLTDCISMETMRQQGLTEILTHDAHFRQEGFVILL